MAIDRTPQKLSKLRKPVFNDFEIVEAYADDLIVVCGGFEARALEFIVKKCILRGFPKVLVLEYFPRKKENRIKEILDYCHVKNLNYQRLLYYRKEPTEFSRDLASYLEGKSFRNIYIDISSMSKLLIVQMIIAIGKLRGLKNCNIVYTMYEGLKRSKRYSEEDGFSPFYTAIEVDNVATSSELSSTIEEELPIRLIAFKANNHYQLSALEWSVPYRAFHLISERPYEGGKAEIFHHIVNGGYSKTFDLLVQLYTQYSIFFNIYVSPTGTKAQSIAVGLLKYFFEDIQVIYPAPSNFKITPETSKPKSLILNLNDYAF